MAGLYTTYRLLEVQRKIKALPAFFLQWFPRQINFEEDMIAFDKVIQDITRVAPFVAPNVQGRVIKEEGYNTKSFKPAYVKPKHVIDPNMFIPRQPGEALGTGSLSIAQRRNNVIAFLLRKHRAMHENTWEMMAAQALQYGYVDVAGQDQDYPARRVDFGRDPALTMTSDWTASSITLMDMISDMRDGQRLVSDKSLSGTVVRDYIFGGEAWDQFVKVGGKELWGKEGLMDNSIRGSETNVTRLWDDVEGVQYMGELVGLAGAGRMRIWVNTQKYRDAKNVEQYLFNQKGVMGISSAVEGVRCFGAVLDKSAGYQAVDYFPKMWEEEDPSVEYLMTQGAPLMVPSDPNATFMLTVKS
ncbi:major head protein [Xanthomonas phage XAP3]|nr:major head protein [Xanthomonas phage XAP3]